MYFIVFFFHYCTASIKSPPCTFTAPYLSPSFPDQFRVFQIHCSIQWTGFVSLALLKFKLKSNFKILINDWAPSWLGVWPPLLTWLLHVSFPLNYSFFLQTVFCSNPSHFAFLPVEIFNLHSLLGCSTSLFLLCPSTAHFGLPKSGFQEKCKSNSSTVYTKNYILCHCTERCLFPGLLFWHILLVLINVS